MALNPSSGWQWFRAITISDPNNVSNDYQLKLTIISGSGTDDLDNGIIYCSKCQNFPYGIRFGTSARPNLATQLPQWYEISSATSAEIWVKWPSNN